MKRGFLNTKKAKQRVAEAVDAEPTGGPPPKESKDKDKKGERLGSGIPSEYVDFNTIDPQELPKPIRQQVDNNKNCVGYGKNRVLFRVWPRDPKGKIINHSIFIAGQGGCQ